MAKNFRYSRLPYTGSIALERAKSAATLNINCTYHTDHEHLIEGSPWRLQSAPARMCVDQLEQALTVRTCCSSRPAVTTFQTQGRVLHDPQVQQEVRTICAVDMTAVIIWSSDSCRRRHHLPATIARYIRVGAYTSCAR